MIGTRSWLTGITVLLAAGTLAAAPKEKSWLSDYEAARAAARRAGKPLLVVFR